LFFAQNYSTFRFVDSNDNKDDLNYTIGFGYGALYQKAIGDFMFLRADLLYNKLGATSQEGIEKLDWELHYAGVDAFFGLKMDLGRLKPYAQAGLYYSYLLKADQHIGVLYYDLIKEDLLNKSDFGLKVSAGVSYQYSNEGNVFISINQDWGLWELEKSDDNQNMYNRNFSIQIGLRFSIVE